MTDGILPDEVNCSAQNYTNPLETTISTVAPVTTSVLALLVVTVVLVVICALVAKRKCQRNLLPPAGGEEREQLVPTETVDPGYGKHALSLSCIRDDIVSACMTHAIIC